MQRILTIATCALGLDAVREIGNLIERTGGIKRCDVVHTHCGRGLVATEDLGPGEVALSVPRDIALVEPDLGEANHWAGRMALRILDAQNDMYMRALPAPPPTPARGDWPDEILRALDDCMLEAEIDAAYFWRHEQWARYADTVGDQRAFLDALDLVCSRTIRIGEELLLVPWLDLANHASCLQGGGYYACDGSTGNICLITGARPIRQGDEIRLDYGARPNFHFLLYYGFVPDRNPADSTLLPHSRRTVSWSDLGHVDPSLRKECQTFLARAPTTLAADIAMLNQPSRGLDPRLRLALQYRLARKTLISAAAGAEAAQAATSAFADDGATAA